MSSVPDTGSRRTCGYLFYTMTLIATIFFLVFLTELISWIGKSVLLELVSSSAPLATSVSDVGLLVSLL